MLVNVDEEGVCVGGCGSDCGSVVSTHVQVCHQDDIAKLIRD